LGSSKNKLLNISFVPGVGAQGWKVSLNAPNTNDVDLWTLVTQFVELSMLRREKNFAQAAEIEAQKLAGGDEESFWKSIWLTFWSLLNS